MATLIGDLLTPVRARLIEPVAVFWTDAELTTIMIAGIKDLWRSIADLKQEHFITTTPSGIVTLAANATQLSGVPADVHKVYMIEPEDLTTSGTNHGLLFKPTPYNNNTFQLARSRDPIDPANDTIYYDIFQAGAPVEPPVIKTAPKVTSSVAISLSYIPTLPDLNITMKVPIPGEADNAIIAWTVAYARAKERDDRSPDPAWLGIYATEKANLLQSLGLREYQEPSYVDAMWSEYW